MPTHAEKRNIDYSAEQLFDIVADVARYPEFLPWCVATRVKSRTEDMLTADMVIGYKMFRERFSSIVHLDRPDRIDVTYTDGPFKYLNNHWKFIATDDGKCIIDFYVDFEFRSKFFQKVIGVVFNEAVNIMVSSFEKRARELYGDASTP